MAYLYTPKLDFPFKKWKVNSYKFKKRCIYDKVDWGFHLGEDCNVKAGTIVKSIGRGKVVYSALRASKESPKKGGYRNWGNVIIIAHKNPETKNVFFSLYGHLGKRLVKRGDGVELGQKIGMVAKAWTQSNGWWEDAHLHLAVCSAPFKQDKVFPGYWKEKQGRTKLKYWKAPTVFIRNYYMHDNLVYIDNHGLLGDNFYWHKGIEIGLSKKDLAKVGLINERVKVHKYIIKPLKKIDEILKRKGYRLYITEGYRSKELYKLINKEISKRIGKSNTERILNMKDMPHTSGKSVDVALWKKGRKVQLHNKEDGINGYFFGFYKKTNSSYHKLQKMLINVMRQNGFRLGKKQEYFHFNYVNK